MRRLPPDHRLPWRDPAMPVLRDYKMADGSTRNVVDPDYERRYREMLVETSQEPSWKNDPTYSMKRKRNGPVR